MICLTEESIGLYGSSSCAPFQTIKEKITTNEERIVHQSTFSIQFPVHSGVYAALVLSARYFQTTKNATSNTGIANANIMATAVTIIFLSFVAIKPSGLSIWTLVPCVKKKISPKTRIGNNKKPSNGDFLDIAILFLFILYHVRLQFVIMLFVSIMDKYSSQVQSYVYDVLAKQGFLYQKALYHHGFIDAKGNPETLIGFGKALRSTVLLLTIESLQKNWRSALPAAAALELFHNATLLVDDWQDKDALRRGRQAVWTMEDVGPEQAVNVAFFLVSLSSDILLRLSPRSFSSETRLRVQSLFEQTKMSVIAGQQKDIAFEKQAMVSLDAYHEMIWLKTGILIQTAFGMGVMLAAADTKMCAAFSDLGKILGLLFQMQDDYLGVYGVVAKTGKPAEDVLHKKKSLTVVLAFSLASAADKEVLLYMYTKPQRILSTADLARVRNIFEKLSIQEKLRSLIEDKYQEAVGLITKSPLQRKKDFLFLADVLAHREK